MQLTNVVALFIFCISSVLSLPINASSIDAPKINYPLIKNIQLVNKKEITISKKTGLRLYKGKPYSGNVAVYYPSGRLSKLSTYVLGLRHGLLKQWFSNGVLSFSAQHAKGILNGDSKSWWRNGNKRSISPFLNGKVHGDTMQWYATGEVFKKMHYEFGKEVGLQQAWRRNGKLYSNYEYVNGRIFGLKRSNMCLELKDEKIIKKEKS